MGAPSAKKRRRDYVKIGANIKIYWTKFADGRTCLDLRKWARGRPTFVNHAEALNEATKIGIEINAGGVDSPALTSADRASYAQAQRELQPLAIQVHSAATEFARMAAAAAKIDHTIAEIFHAGLKALTRPVHLATDVMLEFLMSKQGQDFDKRYARDLRQHIGAFCAAFPGDIAHVETSQIEAWLNGRKKKDGSNLSASRRNHVRDDIVSFFKFARDREYLPDRITAAAKVPEIDARRRDIEIFTVAEMQALLACVEEAWLPVIAIVGFSGVRMEEAGRSRHSAQKKDPLRWTDFDWPEREIALRAVTSKTGRARRLPIVDNLYEWLAPQRDQKLSGHVAPGCLDTFRVRLKRQLLSARLEQACMIAHLPASEIDRLPESERLEALDRCPISPRLVARWTNQLRHSYGSYRMAATKRNKTQVASEMGNSVSMIERHYDNPRPSSQGHAWFSILPANPANVVALPAIITA